MLPKQLEAGTQTIYAANLISYGDPLLTMRVSPQQIANIPMPDIAIVKAYPPPFLGAPGGGAGLAIYTRRGDEASYLPANRQVFKVRGYTPSTTALDMNKLAM